MISYTQPHTLLAADVDLYGRWRPGAIFVAMQETAITHADQLGCGRDPMLEKGMFWVVIRTQLAMQEYPLLGDEVRVTTWPGKTNRGFFPRYHTFTRHDGAAIGAASSLWLIVDREQRNMIQHPDLPRPMPDTSSLTPPLPFPARASALRGKQHHLDLQPQYTDIDVNQHVNNTRYIDWICNALPFEWMKDHVLDNIVVNYLKEIRPEQSLRLEVGLEEDLHQFSMVAKTGDGKQTCFESSGRLAPWTAPRSFL